MGAKDGRQADEIELTPEMIDAAAMILLETEAWSGVNDFTRGMAVRIITAALSASPEPFCIKLPPSLHMKGNALRKNRSLPT